MKKLLIILTLILLLALSACTVTEAQPVIGYKLYEGKTYAYWRTGRFLIYDTYYTTSGDIIFFENVRR